MAVVDQDQAVALSTPDRKPIFSSHPKVSAVVAASAALGLAISIAQRWGITLSAGEVSDLTVLVSAAVGYLVPNGDQS